MQSHALCDAAAVSCVTRTRSEQQRRRALAGYVACWRRHRAPGAWAAIGGRDNGRRRAAASCASNRRLLLPVRRPRGRLPAVTLATTRLYRRLSLAALALVALALRALVPAGFMPVASTTGFAIDFCPGAGAMPPGVVMTHVHPQHGAGHEHHSGGAPGVPHHPPCLFACSATVAGAPAMPALQLPAAAAPASDPGPSTGVFAPSIVRAQSPRAPPVPA